MYVVVGCSECDALWVVEDDVDSTGCPRCGRRHQFDRLKQFVRTDAIEVAREGRAALLAARAGETAAFERFRQRSDVATAVQTPVVDDAEYLEAAGIDPDAVAPGEVGSGDKSGHGDRRSVILAGVGDVDPATESAIVSYAEERGVDAETARSVLDRLVQEGAVTVDGDTYRRL